MRYTKLSLGFLALLSASALLTACTQEKISQNKTEPKTVQTETKTSQKADNQKTDDTPSTTTEASTEQANTESSPQISSDKTSQVTKPQAATTIPDVLVGTWSGTSQQATDVSMTISADGTVSTTATFDSNEGPRLSNARLTQIQDLGNSYYVLSFEGDVEAIMPGITGLGGAGFKTAQGLKIENNVLKVTTWSAAPDQDYDFSQPHEFNFSLQKQ
ncbi:hypothetical protein [Streptococcus fryi]